LFKSSAEGDRNASLQVVFLTAEALRCIAILLQPFIPVKAGELLDRLGVDESRRTFQHAELMADDSYGTSKLPTAADVRDAILFPPLEVTE
jgi:methionyl-tRNA synthetase